MLSLFHHCRAAFAGHAVVAGAFPWGQGRYDMMLGRQLSAVSMEDRKKAAAVAVPIAVKLLRERWGATDNAIEDAASSMQQQ